MHTLWTPNKGRQAHREHCTHAGKVVEPVCGVFELC
jgi:hypothetical protein